MNPFQASPINTGLNTAAIKSQIEQRLRELEQEALPLRNALSALGVVAAATVHVPVADAPHRGRPKGSKNATESVAATAAKKTGRPANGEKADGRKNRHKNTTTLESAILSVITESGGNELMIEQVVAGVRKYGYKSSAENFSNIVYQKLLELNTEKNLLTKRRDENTRKVLFKPTAETMSMLQQRAFQAQQAAAAANAASAPTAA
jgi:hypothetical protein